MLGIHPVATWGGGGGGGGGGASQNIKPSRIIETAAHIQYTRNSWHTEAPGGGGGGGGGMKVSAACMWSIKILRCHLTVHTATVKAENPPPPPQFNLTSKSNYLC